MNIRYDVPLIPQSTGMSCWAASMAMILGWRNQQSIDPATIAANQGGLDYSPSMHSGLTPSDHYILQSWGFVTEPPMCYTVEGFARLLSAHGPLWYAGAVPGPHIRVITGISTGSGADDTAVYINDPWERGMRVFRLPNHGSQYTLTYAQLMNQNETLGRQELRESSPVYVAHMP